ARSVRGRVPRAEPRTRTFHDTPWGYEIGWLPTLENYPLGVYGPPSRWRHKDVTSRDRTEAKSWITRDTTSTEPRTWAAGRARGRANGKGGAGRSTGRRSTSRSTGGGSSLAAAMVTARALIRAPARVTDPRRP